MQARKVQSAALEARSALEAERVSAHSSNKLCKAPPNLINLRSNGFDLFLLPLCSFQTPAAPAASAGQAPRERKARSNNAFAETRIIHSRESFSWTCCGIDRVTQRCSGEPHGSRCRPSGAGRRRGSASLVAEASATFQKSTTSDYCTIVSAFSSTTLTGMKSLTSLPRGSFCLSSLSLVTLYRSFEFVRLQSKSC